MPICDALAIDTTAAQATGTPVQRLRPAIRSVYLTFGCSGVAVAGWASRIPQVRDHFALTPTELGLLLLAPAIGSLIAVPTFGPLVTRYGSRRIVLATTILLGVGLLTVSFGYLVSVFAVAAGLLLVGTAFGAWEVALNVQGAAVERLPGRAILARFHAGFSVGTVIGALVGVVMVTLHVPVTAHLGVLAVLVVATTLVRVGAFVTDHDEPPREGEGRRRPVNAWLEPRTLLIGVLVLAFALAEGTGGDWIGVSVIDSYRAPAAFGTLAYATFLLAMTLGRVFGTSYLDRHGRPRVLRVCALLGIAGILLFVLGHHLPLVFLGALLWGAGASLGYFAFLGGPTMIGLLGSQVTVLRALLAVAGFLTVAALVAGVTRPPPADPED